MTGYINKGPRRTSMIDEIEKHRGKIFGAILLACPMIGASLTTNAQDGAGDREAGLAFALQVCLPCHAVTTESKPRMFVIAPDFQAIANTPGMTATALHAFLMTPHPKMPNLILTPRQSTDVVKYILSLRDRP